VWENSEDKNSLLGLLRLITGNVNMNGKLKGKPVRSVATNEWEKPQQIRFQIYYISKPQIQMSNISYDFSCIKYSMLLLFFCLLFILQY